MVITCLIIAFQQPPLKLNNCSQITLKVKNNGRLEDLHFGKFWARATLPELLVYNSCNNQFPNSNLKRRSNIRATDKQESKVDKRDPLKRLRFWRWRFWPWFGYKLIVRRQKDRNNTIFDSNIVMLLSKPKVVNVYNKWHNTNIIAQNNQQTNL